MNTRHRSRDVQSGLEQLATETPFALHDLEEAYDAVGSLGVVRAATKAAVMQSRPHISRRLSVNKTAMELSSAFTKLAGAMHAADKVLRVFGKQSRKLRKHTELNRAWRGHSKRGSRLSCKRNRRQQEGMNQ